MGAGWQTKRLGDITTLVKGKKPRLFTKTKGKPYLTARVVRGTEVPDLVDSDCPVSVWVKPEDIVIIMDGSNSGEMFTGLDGALASTMGVIKFDEKLLEPRYLYSFLVTHRENFTKSRTGAAIPHLNKESFENLKISTPSLAEQKRIVKMLDEAFEKIVEAKENARNNLQDSKELFESYLQNIFSKPREVWVSKKLKEVTSKIGSGATPRGGKSSYCTEGVSLVRSMNVHDRKFKEKNLAFINTEQANDLNNVTLIKGDVLLNITGASVTRSCVFPERYLPARVNQHVSIIRPQSEMINAFFLNYLLTSRIYKDTLIRIGEQGATRQAITKTQLENLSIVFPPSTQEQELIVKKLDLLSEQIKRLESNYKRKIIDLDELKKSLLTKAFAGEL